MNPFAGPRVRNNGIIIKALAWLPAIWMGMCVNIPVTAAAKLEVSEKGGRVLVDTGGMHFTLDQRRGVITDLSVGGKRLIAGNSAPLLFATVMESEAYDGISDYAPRQFISAENVFQGLKTSSSPDAFSAAGKGTLAFPGEDALDYTLEIKTRKGVARLTINVTLAKRGKFHNRFIREVGARQPLALAHRKRVVQAGDQGLRWDTRYCYQFHKHVEVFEYAEQNWWRHFYVDQDTDHSYHIWRAESEDTGGLHAFHGRRAAGWMTLYDQEGGALFAYRDLSARAPKMLYAGAEKGGEGAVYFYGPTQPAFDPADPRLSAAVFGKPHAIDWIFFAGQEAEVLPDNLLAQNWGAASLPSDGPTQFAPVADEASNLWNAAAATGANVPLVMGGMPVPRGSVKTPDQVRLFVRGRESPLQTKALAYWPDGSIKWLLLVFPLDGDGGYSFSPGQGKDKEAAFRVTLRQGSDVPCVLHFGKGVKAGIEKQAQAMVVRADTNKVELSTGPLRLTLAAGERWLPSAMLNGVEMIADDGRPQACVDFLRVEQYPVGTTHPAGTPNPGAVVIDRIEVEENGPLRAIVRLEGEAKCKEPPRVILRAEVYKGRSFMRLTHSVEFRHKDPREAFVRKMGLRLPLAIDAAQMRAAAGGRNGPVELRPARALGLRQASHVNYEVWRAAENGIGREIADSGHASRGWLAVSDARGGLAAVQRGMWQEAPKELLFQRSGAAFEIGLWPASAPLMDARRYSQYPHRAQGESTPTPDGPGKPGWVTNSYYRYDPFVGVSRTHETLLYFHGPKTTPEEVDSVAADFQSQPLVYAGWPWYAAVGVTFPQTDPADAKFARFNANLDRTADWWLFHQKSWGWYGFWDFGDVRHRFRDGYGHIFPPDTLARLLALPPGEMAKTSVRGLPSKKDYFTQGDWAFDNGRWGWGNTEGLPNHFMSQQYLRTGRRDLYFFMEANARHARDVDARHSGRWFGLGTRHGVQHWSDGNHEERQTTFTEQRFHYLLSGEPRTREWNQDLTDNHYLKTSCGIHAQHSGRSYGLLFNWETTGDTNVGAILGRYMGIFAQTNGIDISPKVKFPEAERIGPPGELNNPSQMFFYHFGAMHALLEYYYMTGDERLRHAIVKLAESSQTRGAAMAFAARHAADGGPYRASLKTIPNTSVLRQMFMWVPANRAHWTGPTASLEGNVSYGLFRLNDAAYIMGALDGEPALTAEQEKILWDLDNQPVQSEPRVPRESWQTEYDDPQFEKYIRDPLQNK